MKNLISIVVPVFNTADEMLKKCVDSLVTQTYENIEIILVDDGSCRRTRELCDSFLYIDSRIKVKHQNNIGLSGARNSGQNAANGEWLLFVDSDDWILKDTCEVLIDATKKIKNCDLVVSGFSQIITGSVQNRKSEYKDGALISGDDTKRLILDSFDLPSVFSSSWGKLYNMAFLKQNNLFHNEIIKQGSEDLEFIIRVLDKSRNVVICNRHLYQYNINQTSITNSFNIQNAYYVQKCFEEIEKYLIKQNYRWAMSKFYARAWLAMCSSVISGFMNPNNGLNYVEKVHLTKEYVNTEICKKIIKNVSINTISFSRKLVYVCIQCKLYFPLYFMAYVRNYQKRR